MKLARVLPLCHARAFWQGRPEGVPCRVRRVAASRLGIEGLWSEAALAVGERLILEVPSDDTLRRLPLLVVEREWGERPTLVVELCGEITESQRRRHGRLRLAVPVTLEGDWGPPLRLFTADVNSRGFRILSPVRLPRGADARVELDLGNDGLLRAEGRVVRSLPHGDEFDIGLQFAPLTELDRDRLVDALIRRVLSEDRA